MGLKPLLFSNQLLYPMDDELDKSVAMILKNNPSQPDGSPLLSTLTKNDPMSNLGSQTVLQPLQVEVNGFRQPHSTITSPIGPASSLVSTALPTPITDMESNSNCSDSIAHGDLYPSGLISNRGATDFRTFTVPKPSPGFHLKSPTTYPHLGPSTSSFPKAQPPKTGPAPLQAAQRRNGDMNRKIFQEKVARHKSSLKFMIPRCGEANPSQLSLMLKKVRKHTVLPPAVESFLFEETVPDLPKKDVRKRKTILEDPDLTDMSDKEEDQQRIPYKKQRSAEKQQSIKGDLAAVNAAIDERNGALEKQLKEYEKKYSSECIFERSKEMLSARCLQYTRRENRKLISNPKPFDYNEIRPSTSKDNVLIPCQKTTIPIEETAMGSLHWLAMNPPFNSRRSLNKPPHLIEAKDLEEEMVRNGTHRRLEKEKRRMKEEVKHSRDSSDYEDTDEDLDYYPEPKGLPAKKKRKRGRPPRQEKRDDDQPASKIGRKSTIVKHVPIYEGDLILDLTQVAFSDDKPKYAQIQIPPFSVVTDESLLKAPGGCKHEYPDLHAQHALHHPILEKDEQLRNNPSKKPARISVSESAGERTPLPSPVSLTNPTA